MRWFTYQGDHEETQLFGLRFRRGVPTSVDGLEEKFIAKLAANSHFSEAFDGYSVSGNTVDVSAVEVAPSFEAPADEPHDSDELEALRQQADSLGVKVDMRWKAARLQREIESARG